MEKGQGEGADSADLLSRDRLLGVFDGLLCVSPFAARLSVGQSGDSP